MKKKLHFKLISFLIILSLIGLETIQGFWLKNFYKTIREQTETKLYNAIKLADYKDLFSRLDELKKQYRTQEADKENRDEFEYTIGLNIDDFSNEAIQEQPLMENEISIRITDDFEEEKTILESLPDYLSMIENLEQLIIIQMHQKVDADLPLDYNRFATLLETELREQNIHVPAQLEIYQEAETPEFVFYMHGEAPIKESPKNMVIKYNSLPVENSYYQLTIQNPQRIILWQMTGILVSTFLLTVVVVAAFIYMLRTIIRQKTDEELKNDFTNNVTHELKTPVSVAMAANDAMLNYDNAATEKQKKYLGIIGEQLIRLTGMIEQILSLSVENRSTFRLTLQKVEIKKLLYSIIEQQKLKTHKKLNVEINLQDGFTIEADKTHVSNMLNNLIENAIKYTPGESVEISISGTVNQNETVLSVSDKGMGINDEHQRRIFEKFYRVPHGNIYNVQGYGLGLYYVADIMKRHNGTVTVKSQPEKGSQFSLIFKNR